MLTEPNYLIFGEGKPSDKKSKKGLYEVIHDGKWYTNLYDLDAFLVLPLISPTGESVDRTTAHQVIISKPEVKLILESNRDLEARTFGQARIFNMVPGVEAIPVKVDVGDGLEGVSCFIRVE